MGKREFLKWKITYHESDVSLLIFLKNKLPEQLPNSLLKRIIEKGLCLINNKVKIFSSYKLQEGDLISLDKRYKDSLFEKKTFKPKILFEDNYFIIADKPVGVMSEKLPSLFKGRSMLVNRLDKGTSGVIILAKSLKTKEKMIEIFRRNEITKTYIALVDKTMNEKDGEIEGYISKTRIYKGKSLCQVDSRGQYACTKYKRLKNGNKCALVLCMPITGRTHQIRVHMQSIGHPILGDFQYSKYFEYPNYVDRIMLHSFSIEFVHPVNKRPLVVKAPLPKDFEKHIEIENIDSASQE